MLYSRKHSSRNHTIIVSIIFLAIVLFLMSVLLHNRFIRSAKAQEEVPVQGAIHNSIPKFINAPNANYRAAQSRKIDTVVVHYMSAINVNPRSWADPKLSMDILKRYHVSAHYVVDRSGTVYRLVNEKNVAWHAGGSIMPSPDNRRNVNSFSVGIELIATDKSGFTDAQYKSLAYLIKGIESRYPIKHIVGHDDIAGNRAIGLGLRKDLKEDPGPLFNWARLHELLQQ